MPHEKKKVVTSVSILSINQHIKPPRRTYKKEIYELGKKNFTTSRHLNGMSFEFTSLGKSIVGFFKLHLVKVSGLV